MSASSTTRDAPTADRRLVHVVAPSGAGKSTLGRRAAELPGVVVVEIDDFSEAVRRTAQRTGEAQARVFERLAAARAAAAPAGSTVLFVGLTGFGPGGRTVPIHGAATYLLDVAPEVLFRQYYRRAAELILSDAAFLDGLYHDTAEILSPGQLHEHIERTVREARALGAVPATADEILAALSRT